MSENMPFKIVDVGCGLFEIHGPCGKLPPPSEETLRAYAEYFVAKLNMQAETLSAYRTEAKAWRQAVHIRERWKVGKYKHVIQRFNRDRVDAVADAIARTDALTKTP